MKNPCKDCKKREVGCHASCKDYLKWKKWNEEETEKKREYSIRQNYERTTDYYREGWGFRRKKK